MRKHLYLVTVLVLTAAACGGDETASWAGTVTDSADVTIVQSPAQGIWEPGSAWSASETLRIGSIDEPDYQFGAITGVAQAPDGRIWVMDMQAQQLKVFSEDGVYERSIGAAGSGPGEFRLGAGPVLVAADGSVHVPDPQNQRVNRFTPDGEESGSYPLRFEEGIPLKWEGSADGLIVAQTRRIAFPGAPPVDDPNDYVVVRGPDGAITDTLFVMESGGSINLGGGSPEITIFAPEPIWTLGHDAGVMFGKNSEYRIGSYDADGRLTRIISKPFELRTVSLEDQEVIKESMKGVFTQSGAPPQALEQLLSILQFGEYFPAFAQVIAGPGGSTWVQHIRDPKSMTESEREFYNPQQDLGSDEWDVFDESGRYLGIVTMPSRFTPLRFYGTTVFGIARDEYDVQYVVKVALSGEGLETT